MSICESVEFRYVELERERTVSYLPLLAQLTNLVNIALTTILTYHIFETSS